MRKKERILLPIILCLALLYVSGGKAEKYWGEYDSGVSWVYENHTLEFSGSGLIESVAENGVAPWFVCMDEITAVVIGNGVTGIGNRVFANLSNLARADLPDSVKNIGIGAFSGCGKLSGITIPNGVTCIEAKTFEDCTGLTSLSIPNGVTVIGDSALRNCDSLTRLTVPASVTSIGDYAFAYSENIQEITFLGTTATFGGKVTDGYTPIVRCYRNSTADVWALGQGYSVFYLGEDPPAAVRITLEENFRLAVGETKQISCQVYPDTEQEMIWSSSKPATASVDSQGKVTAISSGTAEITAMVGETSAAVQVTVYDYVTDFELSESEAWLVVGDTLSLTVRNLQPDDSAYAVFQWTSSNELFATVDENGLVKGAGAGDAEITARTDRNIARKCIVHVCSPVQAITFSQDSYAVQEGGSLQLTAIAVTRDKSYDNNKLVTFVSSDPTVLQVEADGIMTGLAGGRASVTATAFGNVRKTVDVAVVCRNHQTVQDTAKTATCTQSGLTAGEHCERCGTVITVQEVIDALGHQPVQDARTEPTCIQAGTAAGEHCERCGIVLSGREEIPALGHLRVTDEAVAPTCTEAGLTAGEHCERCKAVFLYQEPVAALGHLRVTEEAGKEATCTEPGWTAREVCERCGVVVTEKERIEALGHLWIAEEDHAATCTEAGWTGKEYCERCLTVRRERESIEALGHEWHEVTYTWANDYSNVTAERICARDTTHTERETVPANAKVTKTPTCTESGETTYTSGEFVNPAFSTQIISVTDIPANGHTEVIDEAVLPTVSKTGKTEGKHCSVCGEVLKEQETVPRLTGTYTAADGTQYQILKNKTLSYKKPGKSKTVIIIPATVNVNGEKVRVTAVSTKAFYKNKKLTTVSLGKNVTSVGSQAFASCVKLTAVKGGKALTTIGQAAFRGDTALKAVTLGTKVKSIGKQAFYGCKKLKTITIRTSLLTDKNIGNNAFKGIAAKPRVKCPAGKLKKYRKLLIRKGVPKDASFVQ